MSKLFNVTGLSKSGLEIKDLLISEGLLYEFPFEVKTVDGVSPSDDGLPIVAKSDKPDTYRHWVALGHFIYEEIE